MNIKSNNQNTWNIAFKRIILTVVLIGIIIAFVKCTSDDSNTNSKESLYRKCYFFSQTLVKEKLKSPKSADFPRYSESFITDNGDTIIISAYVDAENSFGANTKTGYVATITVSENKPDKGSVMLLE